MRPRANMFGAYPVSLMTSWTRSSVSGATSGRLFRTRDTVWIETPAAAATSRIVKRFLWAIDVSSPFIETCSRWDLLTRTSSIDSRLALVLAWQRSRERSRERYHRRAEPATTSCVAGRIQGLHRGLAQVA